jgi:hypothetical protein
VSTTLKQKIHRHYLAMANDKIKLLQQTLAGLKESGSNETKSTAGDKHETALAMLQIEQANVREQLNAALAQQDILQKIDPSITVAAIVTGCVIKTNKGYFFMSAALGKAVVDNYTVIALSAQSPLGKKLMGLKAGDTAALNDTAYKIESIV